MNTIFPTEQNNPCTLFEFFNNLRHFYNAILFQILKSCLKHSPPFILLLKLFIKTKIYLPFKNILNMFISHNNADFSMLTCYYTILTTLK